MIGYMNSGKGAGYCSVVMVIAFHLQGSEFSPQHPMHKCTYTNIKNSDTE